MIGLPSFTDLPAEIGYIQKATNYDQIAYVGYSQGTSTMFELLSFRPEVAHAIRPYIALAPVSYLSNMATIFRFPAASESLLRTFLYKNIEFPFDSRFTKIYSGLACPTLPSLVCKNTLYLIFGFSTDQLNS